MTSLGSLMVFASSLFSDSSLLLVLESWLCQALANPTCPQQLLLLPQVQVSEATPGHEPCSECSECSKCCLWRRKFQDPKAPRSRGSEVPRFRPPLHPSSLRMPVVSWPAAVVIFMMFCEGDEAQRSRNKPSGFTVHRSLGDPWRPRSNARLATSATFSASASSF